MTPSIESRAAQTAQTSETPSIFDQLEERIKKHTTVDQDRGLIEKGLSLVYTSDETSLANLKNLQQRAQQSKGDTAALAKLKIEDAIKEDERSTDRQNDISQYGSSLIKGIPLFMAKGKGLILAAAANGIDQVHTNTTAQQMAVDFTLGAGKGVILKKGIEHFGASNAPLWNKGIALGGTMSLADNTLTSKTWYDNKSGVFHLSEGLQNTAIATTFGAATGAVVFPLGGKVLEQIGATKLGAEALQNSGLARNIATGGSFGFVSGSAAETVRQIQSGESIDPLKIASRGVMQSVVDMGSGAAGHKLSFAGRTGESGRTNFNWSEKPATNRTDRTASDSAESQFAQPRAFKIIGGESALTKALGKVDADGATVSVREWLGPKSGVMGLLGFQKFGNQTSMHIQNRANSEGLGPNAEKADLIATCNLEQIFASKSVMPTGTEVFLQSGKNRIRLSSERPHDADVESLKHLGSIKRDRNIELATQLAGKGTKLELGGQVQNDYAHFVRLADGTVTVRGRSRSDGIWTRAVTNKPYFVSPKDLVYFGDDTKMPSHALSQLHLLTPGSAFKIDNRAIGLDYGGKVFITDHGSKDGTYINQGVGRFIELNPEDSRVHLGRFGSIYIRQWNENVLPPFIPGAQIGQQRIPATPGNGQIVAKPAAPPPPIARPAIHQPPVARPAAPQSPIAKPASPQSPIAKPAQPPVIANPGLQGQFKVPSPQVARPGNQQVSNPNQLEVKGLKDFVKANGQTLDFEFRHGMYGDVVLMPAAGGIDAGRGRVTPIYEKEVDARASARFIAGIFRRRLADPNDKKDPGPATWTTTETMTGKDGKTYYIPVVGFRSDSRGGRAVLTPDVHLVPEGFRDAYGIQPIDQRTK